MRDLDTQSGGGIILTRPDNDTLRLSIGGPAYQAPIPRPKLTVVFRPSPGTRDVQMTDMDGNPIIGTEVNTYPTLYTDKTQFFSTDGMASLGFVSTASDYTPSGQLPFYNSDARVSVTQTYPERIRNDFLVQLIDGVALRGEVLRHINGSLVEDDETDDEELGNVGIPPEFIRVSELSNPANYIQLYIFHHLGSDASTRFEAKDVTEWPFNFDRPLGTDYKYTCWPVEPLPDLKSATPEQLLGPVSIASSNTHTMNWATIPAQVYALEQAVAELNGDSVAEVLAKEEEQNSRIVEVERETGISPVDTIPASPEVPFPNTRLVQRLEYLDRLVRGDGKLPDGIFTTFNPWVSLEPFRCAPTTIQTREEGYPPVTKETIPLYNADDLLTKGALGLLWSLAPQIQANRDALLTLSSKVGLKIGKVREVDRTTREIFRQATPIQDFTNFTSLAYWRNDLPGSEPELPGFEVLVVNWPGIAESSNSQTFLIDRRLGYLPPGFAVYIQDSLSDVPWRPPTHSDPSANHVVDPYIPIDYRDLVRNQGAREEQGVFIRYEGDLSNPDDQLLRTALGANYIPLMYIKHEVVPDADLTVVPMDLRGNARRVEKRLDLHDVDLALLYAQVQSFSQRLARLEAWKEAI